MNDEKKLIFCAYAHKNSMESGANVLAVQDKITMYMRNAAVALISAKKSSPDCDVAIITNIELPEDFAALFELHNILIIKADFDSFNFGDNYPWGLAFYKLCALKKCLDLNYDKILLLDTDTYTQNSLDDLWEECEDYIMLYDINHRLSIPHCANFNKQITDFSGINRALTNYGGEFVAMNKSLLGKFIPVCENIFNEMKAKEFVTTLGDEFILCLAAEQMKQYVKNASGYMYRFETGPFFLVSTCYKYNAVSVLHCPAEKQTGFIKVFKYIEKNKEVPSCNKVVKMLHIKKPSFKARLLQIKSQFMK